jgi:hypothetical protein
VGHPAISRCVRSPPHPANTDVPVAVKWQLHAAVCIERMPFLFSEATPEQVKAVQAVEDRADDCYRLLRLLRRPRNLAMWALLTAMAHELEVFQQRYGANSPRHRIALINNDRYVCGFHFIAKYGKPESKLTNFTYNGSLIKDAVFAHNISREYTNFLNLFPMWHKNHEHVDLVGDGRVRFYVPHDSPRQRQVIAYQQIFQPAEKSRTKPGPKVDSQRRQQLFSALFQAARPAGLQRKFRYDPPSDLIEELRPDYVERLDENFRHPDTFQLNNYSLREFKEFYIAVLILCAIHEYICYPWEREGQAIPLSSLVMVRSRMQWIAKLSEIAKLPTEICGRILSDLTLDPESTSFTSLCIHPFVPLDRHGNDLAIAPQFPLASAADENILRSFSYTYPALFSAQNTHKEDAMRAQLRTASTRYRIEFSILLPDGSTEIDVVIEDVATSTVVMAETKWIRKPAKTLERLSREEDLLKGTHQLELIREYGRQHPSFLLDRGKLSKSLDAYENVHHFLLVRDYWHWIEPNDSVAVVDFDEFVRRYKTSLSLKELAGELLGYEWLPVEDRDFHVEYTTNSVNGVAVESALFKHGHRS